MSSFCSVHEWLIAWVAFRIEARSTAVYEVEGRKCLSLYGSLGFECALREDGAFLITVGIEEAENWRLANDQERIWLTIGAQRKVYPELSVLLPLRPVDALDCGECRGSGFAYHDVVICWACSALGWAHRAES